MHVGVHQYPAHEWCPTSSPFSGRDHVIDEDSDLFRHIKAFKLQIDINLGTNAFGSLREAFLELGLPPLKSLRKEMRELAAIPVRYYDMCKNSCMAFVGPYDDHNSCLYCGSSRYRPSSTTPAKQFHYIPITPQIQAMYGGRQSATNMLRIELCL